MTIDAQTGIITWTPIAGQVGNHDVTLIVTDALGASVKQLYTIKVLTASDPLGNRSPVISSNPVFLADPAKPYTYQVVAADPDAGAVLSYSLVTAPAGMTINATTGLVTWTNPTVAAQPYEVIVKVLDQFGLGVGQGYNLTVRSNNPPIIVSTSPNTVAIGTTYRYDVRATDADGDALTYALNQAAIDRGMTIDVRGRIIWTPKATDLTNPVPIVITVKDAQGAIVTQAVNLQVVADTEAPKVILNATTNMLNVGQTVTFEARATDNVGVAGLTLMVNGQAVALDGQGRATVKFDTVQQVTAIATAIDGANNATTSVPTIVNVVDPSLGFDPVINLDLSLLPEGVIKAPTPIRGSVGGNGFLRYELLIAPLDTDDFKVIASGNAAVANGVLGTVDPSLLLNDTYRLRLVAYGTNGRAEVIEDQINIEGELKLGNFRLSFTDLAVPVTGIPISLTRTYDTLTANQQDDFGYGWRMEFRDTDLRTSLGKRSEAEEELGRYPAFKDNTKVFITLPGGKREAYTFKAKRVEYFQEGGERLGTGQFANYLFEATFESEKGSTNKLTIEKSSIFTRNASGSYSGFQGQPFNPADNLFGGVYVLTSKDGSKYRIDAATGDLLTVQDTNGNTLTYTDSEIKSSTGQKVTFERDAQGRIVAVKDPMGELLRYGYDAQGDLVSVTDREQNTTRMVYDTSYDDPTYPGTGDAGRTKRSHYLREIIDPLGRVGARSTYDEVTGRLKQIVDVNGKSVDMTYDPGNSKQIVKDQLGHETLYVYDERGNVTREVDAEGKITDRTYDANNWTLSETVISDRSDNPATQALEGYTTTYTYDTQGNKLTETNHLNQTMIYTYGDKSRLLTETDALGRTTTNVYDGNGNLVETRDSKKQSSKYAYDTTGQLKSVKDANQKETFFTYDPRGNVAQVKDAQGNITDYEYNLRGDKTVEKRYRLKADGTTETLLTKWTYDKEGRMKTMTDAQNFTSTYGYDKQGRQVWMLDAKGRLSESKYNDKGEMVESWSSDGTIYQYNAVTDALVVLQAGDPTRRQVNSTTYDEAGRKVSQTDALGRVTKFVYDKVGRLVETIAPDLTPTTDTDNPRTKTEYYTDGLVKASIDELGHRTEFRYDELGRQIAVIAADATPNDLSDNPTSRYVYDKAGQQKTMTDALGHVTTYEYDDLGRMAKTIFDDKTFVTQEYDKLGRRVAAVDQNGKRTEYRYDDLGRLTGVKDALLHWTEYGYNELGQMVSMTDAELHTTRYEYDILGRRSATILPLTQRSAMTYDEVGNLKTTTDFNGKTITFNYDQQNRLTEKLFQDGSKVQYAYLRNGLQDTVTFRDSSGLVTSFYDYDYDVRDRLTKRTDSIDGVARSINYGYDIASNRTSVTTASGTTTYTYDDRNRLDLVKLNGALQADYDYDAASRLTQTTFGNGTRENRSYDTLNRLTTLETKRLGDNVQLSKYVYTLDKVGNRKSVAEAQNGQVRSIGYSYDDLYRLTGESIVDGVNGNRTSTYVYDKVGNRQTKTVNGTTTTYAYDGNDRLLNENVGGVVTASYGYDNNGSTLTKTENGVTTTYVWNDEKRLVSATVGTTQIAYVYNDQGIRVASKQNGAETRYLLDEGMVANVWEEYTPNGTVQASYVYGSDLITQTQAGQTSYYLVDGLGSTRLLTDAQGQVLNAYGYEAFGETVSQSGTASNKYQYAGEQLDAALGDYYLRQRFYDTSSGRFSRMDTYEGQIQKTTTLNKYTYANANPAYWVDPSGFTSFMPFPYQTPDQIKAEAKRLGAEINNIIGLHFIAGDFGNREYDHHYGDEGAIPAGASTVTLRKIILRAALAYNEFGGARKRGMPDTGGGISDNRKAPDLVDFGTYELYEIKPSSRYSEGVRQVIEYLPILNAWEYPDNNFWKPGRSYAPPSMIISSRAKVYSVDPPRQGVITYTEQVDLKGLAAAALYISLQSMQTRNAQLQGDTVMAIRNAAAGAF
jgi:RHS repeat-associated protein